MTQALGHWKLLEFIPNSELSDIYGILSNAVHSSPHYVDAIMRATFLGNPYIEPAYIPEPMKLYLNLLKIIVDISLVISFNVLKLNHNEMKRNEILADVRNEFLEYKEMVPFFFRLL